MLPDTGSSEVGQLRHALEMLSTCGAEASQPDLEGPAALPRPGIDTEEIPHLGNFFHEMDLQAHLDKAHFLEAEIFEENSSGEDDVWDYALCNSGTAPIQKEPPVAVPRLYSLGKIGGRGYREPSTSSAGCGNWGFGWFCSPAKLDGAVDRWDGEVQGYREAPCGLKSSACRQCDRQCKAICDDDGY
mmetsp:Transcript_2367/g.4456  ORF Transcript_2367/g.4456 Transcript_2367/m.4456 type:complete len:187 (+) Transcript_2367:59-619(+)